MPLVRSEMTDMPNLQKLTISSVCEGRQIEKDINLSQSTQLRALHLDGVGNTLWRSVMKTIHTQKMLKLRLGIYGDNSVIDDPYLITSLGVFTNLKRLEINFGDDSCFEFGGVWSGPPILLSNLTVFVLTEDCSEIIEYFTLPSLISLSISMSLYESGNKRGLIPDFLSRSNPPLETMQSAIDYLGMDDLISSLRKVPTLKILSLTHARGFGYEYGRENILHDLWSFISVDESSTDVLVPNLMGLHYNVPSWFEVDMVEGVRRLVKAVLSRKRYCKDFYFHPRGLLRFCEGFPEDVEESFESISDEDDDDYYYWMLQDLFRIS